MNRHSQHVANLVKYPTSLRIIVLAVLPGVFSAGMESRGAAATLKEAQQAQATAARKACLSGDYQKGVALLTDLFVETKDPVMIFNQGRCFEQNSRYEEAISRFEEYLRLTKNTGAKDRADAEEHVADCQAKLDKARVLAPPPADAPRTTIPTAPPITTVATAPAQSGPGSDAGSGLRLAGIVVGSAGVVALGTAILMTVEANKLADQLNSPTGYDRSKVSEHSTYKALGYLGYGVGAACLVGGAVLYGLGATQSSSSPVALVPTFGPGHTSLSLQGVF